MITVQNLPRRFAILSELRQMSIAILSVIFKMTVIWQDFFAYRLTDCNLKAIIYIKQSVTEVAK